MKGKILLLVSKLEKLSQARISRTRKLKIEWKKKFYILDSQSNFKIDYSKFPSTIDGRRKAILRYFKMLGGGERSVIISQWRESSSSTSSSSSSSIRETKRIITNVTVNSLFLIFL